LSVVVDASIAVNALRPREPGHARSKAWFLAHLADAIVVPSIFPVEFVASLVRGGVPAADARGALAAWLGARAKVVTLGPRAAAGAGRVAEVARLRAADSFYVWTAQRYAMPIVTYDREILDRAHLAGVTAVEP
jgi:predicted nucleic acid-binding protein